jgi:hypothetical protein
VGAEFVINAYHQLWRIEKRFPMSKHDLQARPICHHKRESIDAHLTIVFAALGSATTSSTKLAGASRNSSELRAATAPSALKPDGKSSLPQTRYPTNYATRSPKSTAALPRQPVPPPRRPAANRNGASRHFLTIASGGAS